MWRQHLFLFGVAFFVAASLNGAEPSELPNLYRMTETVEGHFRCEIPGAWGVSRELREENRIHYHGFYLVGPKQEEPLHPTISLRYFAPDNTIFSGLEGYLRRQLEPGIVQLRGEKTSELKDTLLDGRPAKTFTRDTSEFFPPDSLDTVEIPFHEEYIVAPHLGGFVVLKYAAPTSMFDRVRPAFQRILDTFRLTPERLILTLRAQAPPLESAREVDEAVARPLLARLADLPGLLENRCSSRPRQCVLWLTVSAKAEPSTLLSEIQRRVTLVQEELPPGTYVELDAAVAEDAPLLLIALTGSDPSRPRSEQLQDLRTFADAEIRSRVSVLPGVASVTLAGGGPRYEVVLSPEKLMKFDLDTMDLLAAVKRLEGDAAPEKKERGTEHAMIARIESPNELNATVVGMRDGAPVRLGDMAESRVSLADDGPSRLWLRSETRGAATPHAALLTVESLASADPYAVNRAVVQALNDLRSILPEFMAIECHEIGSADVSMSISSDGDIDDAMPILEKTAAAVAKLGSVQSVWRLDGPSVGKSGAAAEFLVAIDPSAAAWRDDILKDLRKLAAEQLPRANVSLGNPRPPQTRFPGVVSPLTITVSGTDLESLQTEAEAILERLQKVAGIVDLYILPALPGPTLQFNANRDSAARYGVDVDEIVHLATCLWERRPVAKIVGSRGRPTSVFVALDQNDPATLGSLPIHTPVGAVIPLQSVVDIRHTADAETVFRKNGRRIVVVHFNIQGRDTEAVLLDLAMILNTLEHTEGNAVEFNRE